MPGGAPQGTKCGNFLFCVAIADLDVERPVTAAQSEDLLGQRDLARRIGAAADFLCPASPPPSSPLGGRITDTRLTKHLNRIEDSSDDDDDLQPMVAVLRHRHHIPPPRWTAKPCSSVMFIDDLTGQEKCDVTCSESTISVHKELRNVHASAAEKLYRTVKENAESIGMIVNAQKPNSCAQVSRSTTTSVPIY